MRTKHTSESKIDWMITLVPLGIIIGFFLYLISQTWYWARSGFSLVIRWAAII